MPPPSLALGAFCRAGGSCGASCGRGLGAGHNQSGARTVVLTLRNTSNYRAMLTASVFTLARRYCGGFFAIFVKMPLKIFSFLPSQTEPSIRRLSITPLSPLLRSHLLRYFWDQCSIRAQLLLVVAF